MLSVIIPTLNEEKCIASTLKAIKRQNVEKEIIVFDSESTDRTAAIARKYADKVIVSKKSGVGLARNEGAKHAKGDILLFIDADIRINQNVLKRVIWEFKDPKLVGLCGEAYSRGKLRYRIVYRVVYWITRVFLWFGIPLFPSMFVAYRKKQFWRIRGFKNWISAEDYDISYRMKDLGRHTMISGGIYTPPRRLQGNLFKYMFLHFKNGLFYLLFRKEGTRDYPALR